MMCFSQAQQARRISARVTPCDRPRRYDTSSNWVTQPMESEDALALVMQVRIRSDKQGYIGILRIPDEMRGAADLLDTINEVFLLVSKHFQGHAAWPHLHAGVYSHLE